MAIAIVVAAMKACWRQLHRRNNDSKELWYIASQRKWKWLAAIS
jgi:hypothetical protein